jgi:WD40 repeat protein
VAGAGPARPTNPKPASAFFNGEDLSGWEGLPGYWDVKDGAIVGRPPPGRPAHTFLVSRKKYRDFDLKFEARRLDGVGNSGVQFRSRLIDAGQYKVVGPQVEIDSLDYNFPPGSLLTEPNLKPLHEKAPRDEVARVYKDADFNAFHVRCVGKHVTIRVNGVTTIDGDFDSLPDEGVIAWQLHGRMTPKEVTFRNIEFTDLSRAAEGFVPLFNGRDLSGWEPVGTGRWIIENGTLRTLGKDGPGWLATERDYDDLELELEYRLGPRGNSGVFVRAWTGGDPGGGQFVEIQLIDDKAYGTDGRVTGTAAIYGVVAPEPTVRPTLNTWHKLSVRAKGRRLQVSFDTRQVIDANLDEYPNFFQRFPGLKRASGRIGLQNTGTPVEFRNIKIKELSAGGAGNLEAGGGKVSKAPGEKVGEVRRFEGHKDAIHCVAVSPDGRLAASASGAWYLGNGRWVTGADDLTARLWDLATGRELHCLDGHSGTVTKVAFSPGGDRLVTCGTSDQTIRVWDTRTGKELRCIKETHAPQVRAVAFLPDGRRILSAGHDKMVRLWDGETGEQLRQFEGHAEVLHTVAVSPDGHRAASGGWEKAIRLWDLDTGQELRQFEGHTEAIHGLAFSPDGRRLLSASYDNSVRLWAVATGKELKRLDGHTDIVATVAFSPDGRRALSSGFDQTLRLWDLETGKELHCFRGTTNAVIGAAFTPDGRYALSGGADKVMRLWRLPDPPPAKVGEVGRFEESDVARPGT